jgi:hypothetical protein
MRKIVCLGLFLAAMSLFAAPVFSQVKVSFDDMDYWQTSDKTNWQVAGKVAAIISKNDSMVAEAGKGVLVNLPSRTNRANLVSKAEYGDVDVSFEFMMARHSNSGFYLQGRYEVQLLDSWGVAKPSTGDCGGIYKRRRWENGKEILWEGHAPRVNACIAAGLWQKMEIAFQAPRFNTEGVKIANAKILKIVLNGMTIHENVELTGQTGGPIQENEVAKGPFMIQGDHGPVAFRNMVVKDLSGEPTALKTATYKFSKGKFKDKTEVLAMKAAQTGSFDKLTWELSDATNEFAEVINGSLSVKKAGKYRFRAQAGGSFELSVNGKAVMPYALSYTWSPRNGEVDLPEGDVPFEVILNKQESFIEPILGLWVESNAHRPVALHDFSSLTIRTPVDAILLDAKEPTIFRSFVDVRTEGGKTQRLNHSVSVGNPLGLHYTYNLDNGAVPQIWKGEFLDNTPMWDNRGNGVATPRGAVLSLGNLSSICTEGGVSIGNDQTAVGTAIPEFKNTANFRTLGYDLDKNKLPTFRYAVTGATIEDQIRPADDRQSILRTISILGTPTKPLFVRMATAKTIVKVADDLFLIGDNQFFIKTTGATIEKQGEQMALMTPLASGSKVSYAILW